MTVSASAALIELAEVLPSEFPVFEFDGNVGSGVDSGLGKCVVDRSLRATVLAAKSATRTRKIRVG